MSINQQHRKNIIALYCIIFYALMVFKWWGGLFLYQVKPFVFNTRFDVFTWIFMQTGLHQWLMTHPVGWYVFDLIFYILPLIYWFASLKNVRAASIVAICMLVVKHLV